MQNQHGRAIDLYQGVSTGRIFNIRKESKADKIERPGKPVSTGETPDVAQAAAIARTRPLA